MKTRSNPLRPFGGSPAFSGYSRNCQEGRGRSREIDRCREKDEGAHKLDDLVSVALALVLDEDLDLPQRPMEPLARARAHGLCVVRLEDPVGRLGVRGQGSDAKARVGEGGV